MLRALPLRSWLCAFVLLAACGSGDQTTPDASVNGSMDGGLADGAVDEGVPHVNPFIGTGGNGFDYASCFPGAVAPQGLVKLGPDTSSAFGAPQYLHFSGYWAGDDTIDAFTHLHLHGTGAADYGVLGVMPSTKPLTGADAIGTTPALYHSKFDKSSETASPGYYAVTLTPSGIRAELTATTHAGYHRYTYPAGASQASLIVDLDKHLDGGHIDGVSFTLDPAKQQVLGQFHSVGGMSGGFGGYEVYFDLRTKQPWSGKVVWSAGSPPADGTTVSDGSAAGFALSFGAPTSPIEVRVGISMVSLAGATANLEQEIPDWTFDQTRAATADAWSKLIGTVKVQGGTVAQQTMLMTALYHSFLMPAIHSDDDGSYVGFDKQVHTAQGFHFVSEMSLWDTYRTLHPLYALVAPDRALDAVRSLDLMDQQGGFFPKWPLAEGDTGSMIGASAEIVIAGAWLRGITGFDAMDVYSRLRPAALDTTDPPGGRGGRDEVAKYMLYGYVPREVSKTTEYAADDYALANLAGALGQTADQATLMARSHSWRALFDPATGFLWGKTENGAWMGSHADPTVWQDDFVEADAWQSLWEPAQHDLDGMITLFGGRDAFLAKLTDFFQKAKDEWDAIGPNDVGARAAPRPYYWQGNEPDLHAAWLFSQAGRPDLTQKWVRWIQSSFYNDGPTGVYGNDDGGTMSSWYVWASLGIYPIPGSDLYVVGAPLFPHIELGVPGGTFTIDAQGVSAENLYVQSVTFDGAPLDTPQIKQSDLKPGGSLEFVMGPAPSSWGVQ